MYIDATHPYFFDKEINNATLRLLFLPSILEIASKIKTNAILEDDSENVTYRATLQRAVAIYRGKVARDFNTQVVTLHDMQGLCIERRYTILDEKEFVAYPKFKGHSPKQLGYPMVTGRDENGEMTNFIVCPYFVDEEKNFRTLYKRSELTLEKGELFFDGRDQQLRKNQGHDVKEWVKPKIAQSSTLFGPSFTVRPVKDIEKKAGIAWEKKERQPKPLHSSLWGLIYCFSFSYSI